jgi:uncharacterized membrane protein SirB2
MNLRAFHVLFISLATTLMFVFAVWTFVSETEANTGMVKILGAICGVLGIVLGIYGITFYRKLKNSPIL